MAGYKRHPAHVRGDRRGGGIAARTIAQRALVTAECALSGSIVYLLVLLAAAAPARVRRPRPSSRGRRTRDFVVVVPAHDEEAEIAGVIDSLHAMDYPRERTEIVVVADNCRDGTARVAARSGATVYERSDSAHRGKGHALAWGTERILQNRPQADALVMVDADCRVSANLLSAIDDRLAAGASVVQVNNVVDGASSSSSALRSAAVSLMNTVRPLGKDALGLSCGLFGTGMAFTRRSLERSPWESRSLAEDQEQHLRLVSRGERVTFAPEGWVVSPVNGRGFSQELRWEGGRTEIVRDWAPRLIREGIRRRDLTRLHAGCEHFVPPQSLLGVANLALAALAVVLGSRPARRLAAMNLVGHALFVLGGLAVARAPARVYRSLLLAPALATRKVVVYARILTRRAPRDWVRTGRSG